jgi:hypothetical protein
MGTAIAMEDRIESPWGERAPFGAGEEWPTRVDRVNRGRLDPKDLYG